MPNERIVEFDLNFIPTGVPPIVHIHQYDRGTIVTLKPTLYYGKDLYSGLDLSGCDFIVAYRRKNGTQQTYTIMDHTFEDEHTLSFKLDELMSCGYGPNVMALGFYTNNNSNILWSQNFILEVEKHPIQEGDLAGTSNYEGMIRQFQDYIDEAFGSTPEGYEEHLAKIRQVEDDIDNLRQTIRDNAEEANAYVDSHIDGLSSIYQTLDAARQAALEGREYAGTLVGDLETRVLSDMALTYTTKEEMNGQMVDLQIYADQVTEISATEFRQRLGIEYTQDGVNFTENGALSAEISRRADQVVQELTASFVTEDEVEGITEAYADSKITQKANEISASIQQIYETKEDANSKLLTAQSYTDSQLIMSSTQIRTEVNSYTDNKIRGLKIGAQNLLRGTNEYPSATSAQYSAGSYNSGTWSIDSGGNGTKATFDMDDPPGGGFTVGFSILNNSSGNRDLGQSINPGSIIFTKNKVYTISGYVRVNPNSSANSTNYLVRIWGYEVGSNTDSACESWSESISKSDGWVYFEETFTVDWDVDRITYVLFGISGSGSVDWCGCKLEEGNKATAWQPNEFDIKNYVNTAINQTNERISLLAEAQSETEGRLSTMSSRMDVEAGKIAAMVQAGYIEPDGNNGWTSTYSTVQLNRALTEVSNKYHINENTIAALQTGIDDTGDAVTLYSRQMRSIGVENLIRSTDLVTQLTSSTYSTWNQADDKYGWRAGSNNTATKTRITLSQSDRPLNNVTRAWRIVYDAKSSVDVNHVTQDNVPMVYGKTYTMSCYARCTSGSGLLHLQTWKASDAQHTKTTEMNSSVNSSWALYSFTFTHDFASYKNDTNIYFGVQNKANAACTIEICAMKLELGEIATVWCPSVFDVEAQTQAFIKVESNAITQQVSNINGEIAQIKLNANNLTLKVGNMQVGGTNLCLDSKKDANQSHTTYNIADFNLEESLVAGKTYTVSAKITLSSERQQVGFFHSGGSYAMADVDDHVAWIAKTGETAIYKRTFVATANMAAQTSGIGHGYVRVYSTTVTGGASQGSTAIAGTGHVDWIKLEEGNMASGWSPAPGDMQDKMDGNDVITLINLSSTTATIQAQRINLNGAVTFNSLNSTVQNQLNNAADRYGVCSTASGTAAKTVTLSTGTLTSLTTGTQVSVYFQNANTAGTPTLNVNNTGAKAIRAENGSAWTTASNWVAGALLQLTYNGTYWIISGGSADKTVAASAASAQTSANNAQTAANNAQSTANTATTKANTAQSTADSAKTAAANAQTTANNAATAAANAQSTANSATTKANSAIKTARNIYYRKTSSGAPSAPGATAVTRTDDVDNAWTLAMPSPKSGCYYWHCVQYTTVGGTTACTSVTALNDAQAIGSWCAANDKTYIDGGKLYNGSVTTGKIKLGGVFTIYQDTNYTNSGGTIGYGTGNDGESNTSGMLLRRDDTHRLFISNAGAILAGGGRVTLQATTTKCTGNLTCVGLTTTGATYISGGLESNVTSGVIQVGKANTTTNIGMYSSGGMSGSGTVTRQSNGYVKVGSSNRYKKNLERYLTSDDVKAWYDLPIYYGSYKDEYMEEGDNYYHKHLPMFTVDDIEEIYPVANFHNEDGTLDNCAWDSFVIIPIMLKMIQDMKHEIDDLKGE